MKPKQTTTPGRYYERTPAGLVDAAAGEPDTVICRRAVDFAPAPIPPGAALADCTRCGARIAFNPNGPHPDVPKVCMQCAGVSPLPYPTCDIR